MLEFLTQSAWVDRIGWVLVHSLWQFALRGAGGDRAAAGVAATLGHHSVWGIAGRHVADGRHAGGDVAFAVVGRSARGGGQASARSRTLRMFLRRNRGATRWRWWRLPAASPVEPAAKPQAQRWLEAA